MFGHFLRNEFSVYNDPTHAVDALAKMYHLQIQNLRAIGQKDGSAIAIESPVYPLLSVHHEDEFYCSPLARPDLFYDYYMEECKKIKGPFAISKSENTIPLSLIDEDLALALTQEQMVFRKINVLAIESVQLQQYTKMKPLHWFSPERVDYSINRLKHYTGLNGQNIQNHIMFVNYQKYLPYFIEYAMEEIAKGNFDDLIGPGNTSLVANNMQAPEIWNDSIRLPQMPAYSLVRKKREGITLVNIGVGPSNAKTLCDHLSALRPKFGLMVGHCGGLKQEHQIGDYILGLDHSMIDFCAIENGGFTASYTQEMRQIVGEKKTFIGPVASIADRNWELHASDVHKMLNNMDAIGIDMESAMIVKCFSECGIPAASFLCISDKPFHRQVRLQKMAENFYNHQLKNHFANAMDIMESVACRNCISKPVFGPLFR